MALQRVTRQSVPDAVFAQLLGEVVGGELRPGDPLPSERRLAEVLGVSRPAVREALQRMAHAGLVDVRQGDATTVRDFRRFGGLDLLPRLLLAGGDPDLSVVRSILEARLHIGPKIAELAAERGDASVGPMLDTVVAALGDEADPVRKQRLAVDFWQVLVDAADSITFRLMFNSMLAAYEPALDALAVVMSAEVEQLDAYAAVAAAVTDHDGPAARTAAHALLGHATTALTRAIDTLEDA